MAKVLPFSPVTAPDAAPQPTRRLLGDILVDTGAIDRGRLAEALEEQQQQDQRIGRILVANRLICEDDLTGALSRQSGLGLVDLVASPVDRELARGVDPYRCLELEAVPWRQIGGTRIVAISNPENAEAAMAACGGAAPRVALALASPADLRRAIVEVFAGRLRDDARTRCPEAFSCRGWTEAPSRWRWAALGFAGAIGVAAAPLVALQLVVAWVLLANAMTMGLRLVAIFARLRRAPAGARRRRGAARRLQEAAASIDPGAAPARGGGGGAAHAGARRDGLPGAAARHQARPRGRRRDHPCCGRPRRVAGDDRGRHRARRRPEDQAAGDELRAALLPRRHRRHLRRRGPPRPGPDPRGGPASAGGAARGRLRAGLSRLLQLGRQLAGALLHARIRDLVPGGAARGAAARAADPARRHQRLLPPRRARADRRLGRPQRHRGRGPGDAPGALRLSDRDDRLDHLGGGELPRPARGSGSARAGSRAMR